MLSLLSCLSGKTSPSSSPAHISTFNRFPGVSHEHTRPELYSVNHVLRRLKLWAQCLQAELPSTLLRCLLALPCALLCTSCAVLCCAVLCCAVLCCAVLCCAVLCSCSVLCAVQCPVHFAVHCERHSAMHCEKHRAMLYTVLYAPQVHVQQMHATGHE